MNLSEREKEWLHKFIGDDANKSEEEASTPAPSQRRRAKESASTKKKSTTKGNGFGDIAGMNELKKFIREEFIDVLKNKESAKAYCIKPPSMLFYGPPGCGKTFFAEKIAEEAGINFMKVVPDDIASTCVHGTQELIGKLFREAESKAPTLMFFDEFEAMVPQRTGSEHNQHYDSEVNEFLCMLNNANDRGIYVVAASNFPQRIDKAVLRTGRIDEMVYIDLPDQDARKSLFTLLLGKRPSEVDIDIDHLATLTKGYTCSDISYIIEKASRKMFAVTIKSNDGEMLKITQALLEEIIADSRSSVTSCDIREYERVRQEFTSKHKSTRPTKVGYL